MDPAYYIVTGETARRQTSPTCRRVANRRRAERPTRALEHNRRGASSPTGDAFLQVSERVPLALPPDLARPGPAPYRRRVKPDRYTGCLCVDPNRCGVLCRGDHQKSGGGPTGAAPAARHFVILEPDEIQHRAALTVVGLSGASDPPPSGRISIPRPTQQHPASRRDVAAKLRDVGVFVFRKPLEPDTEEPADVP